MAQQVVITDDLDESPEAKTTTFALMGRPYEIDLSEKNIEKLEKVLQPFVDKARPAGSELAQRQTRAHSTTPTVSAPTKTDYTLPENAGLIHRGRVTEAEAQWVRENLDEANNNRIREGQPIIDPNDPTEKKRYGF